jgi:hypothetical protein
VWWGSGDGSKPGLLGSRLRGALGCRWWIAKQDGEDYGRGSERVCVCEKEREREKIEVGDED